MYRRGVGDFKYFVGISSLAQVATREAYRRSQLAFYDKHHPRWTPFLRLYLRLRGVAVPVQSGGRPT